MCIQCVCIYTYSYNSIVLCQIRDVYLYTTSFILASSQRNMWQIQIENVDLLICFFHSTSFSILEWQLPQKNTLATSNLPFLAFFGQENQNWRNRVSLVFRWTKSCSEHVEETQRSRPVVMGPVRFTTTIQHNIREGERPKELRIS